MSLVSHATPRQTTWELFGLVTHHRELTWELTKREIRDRYAGQAFGTFWAVGHPMLLMGIYLFIFGFVFKARLGGTAELPLGYTVYLLSGLIPWLATQEALTKGVVALSSNATLIKQVVFPIEVLPVKSVLASILTLIVPLLVLILYVAVTAHALPWTYVLIPFLILLQTLALIGICYILASVGAYFKDLKDVVQALCLVGTFLLPIFYLPEWVPAIFRPILYFNPFTYMVWCYQDVLYFGRFEHPWAWAALIGLSFGSMFLGYLVFRKLKPMLGNVL